jgi:hypothetical protein
MTDKKIINGVDVSGCDFLGVELTKKRMCACSMIDFCNEEPNCYYKQLKRAEQKLAEKDKEIERLKQGIKHYQRGMFSIINTATECRNNKQWNYK